MTTTGNLSIEAQARSAYIAELIQSDFPPPARVLELGSAPRDQIAALARVGYTATSLDIGTSADAWGSGEEGRMRLLLLDAGVTELLWNLGAVPYPVDSASRDVVMMEIYESLRDYPLCSFQEVKRILAPQGRLYFTTPNAAYIMNRVRAAMGRNIATPLHDWIGGVPHARHAREYMFGEVAELMEFAALRVVEVKGRHFHLDSGRTSRASSLAKRALGRLARVRPTLGPCIIAIAGRD